MEKAEWDAKLAQLANIELEIRSCKVCGSPHHLPNKCWFCGSYDP